ncbi:hypothetical protein [Puniceibacterium sp. IMCC21224]|nr:hypothetical protein [Puniceibacterium sp. IMCC21224]KMK68033.1 hypothetical protein IMCC21224_112910 [Puniceibacterium sp. IMCC21224]
MRKQRRFITSVIETAGHSQIVMPWARRTRGTASTPMPVTRKIA